MRGGRTVSGITTLIIVGAVMFSVQMCIRDRMHTPEWPQKYLRMNFYQQYSDSGVPFLDYRCTPVSYTHLDVYKRQAISSPTIRRRQSSGTKSPIRASTTT